MLEIKVCETDYLDAHEGDAFMWSNKGRILSLTLRGLAYLFHDA